MNKKKRQVQPLSSNSTISISADPLKDRLKHPYWEKKWLNLGLGALIAVITFLVYLPSLQNGFVNWDDNLYVFENLNIRSIDLNFIKWSLTAVVASLWHPLTLLSLALDYAIWGLNPSGYHLTSILLHSLNTFLVFVLTVRLCNGQKGFIIGIVTALLFGIHPLHVESVAWVSERKDVLCAFFFLLSLLSYARYASEKNRSSYVLSLAFFIFALMSKPMAVTLPIVLLILDYYPFKRFTIEGGFRKAKEALLEKVPFLLFSFILSAITIWAHKVGGGLSATEQPLLGGLLIAAHSYIFYLSKMFLPHNLAPLYPLPEEINPLSFEYIGAIVTLSMITLLAAWSLLKKNSIFPAVWFYYLITLSPVIGVVQFSGQAAADRYTYLPSLGPFLITGVVAGFIFERYSKKHLRLALVAGLIFLTGLLSYKTINQIAIWRDSITLWSQVIRLSPGAIVAYNNRGTAYYDIGNYQKALNDFDKLIQLLTVNEPDKGIQLRLRYAEAYGNRGETLNKIGNYREAIKDFNRAIELIPEDSMAYYNRGLAYGNLREYGEAIRDFSEAIRLNPQFAEAYNDRGVAYSMADKYQNAIKDLERAIALNQHYAEAYNNRGIAYFNLGAKETALRDFNEAVKISPQYAAAFYNLGLLYLDYGSREEALVNIKRAADLGSKQAKDYLLKAHPEMDVPQN